MLTITKTKAKAKMINTKRMYIVNHLLVILPNSGCQKVKASLLRWAGVKVGRDVEIFQGVKIQGVGEMEIENKAFIGHEALLMVNEGSKIRIEEEAIVSSRTTIITGFHKITPTGKRILSREGTTSTIDICRGCCVLAGAIILPGVTIGEMSIVAAGSVVTKDVAPYTMVAGVPAVFKKKLKND